jgi:hypothetical protein
MPEAGWAIIAGLCGLALVFLAIDMLCGRDDEPTWFPMEVGLIVFGLTVPIVLKALLY